MFRSAMTKRSPKYTNVKSAGKVPLVWLSNDVLRFGIR